MDSIVNTFSFELEHGGPHVHFLAFLLFIFIGIVILHGVFRIVIEVLSRVTKIPRDSWRNIFRFMPTLLVHADPAGHPPGHPVDQGYPESA